MEQLDRIVHQVYEAALDDDGWPEAMEAITVDALGSAGGLNHNHLFGDVDPIHTYTDIDVELSDRVSAEYDTPDKHIGLAACLRAPIGEPFLLESFVDRATFESNDGVRMFFQPQKLDKAMFVVFGRAPDTLSFVGLFRRRDQAPYDADDEKKMAILAPHLARAIKLRDLTRSRKRREQVRAVLAGGENDCRAAGRPPAGIVTTDARLRIIDADAVAQCLLDRRTGLTERQGRIASLVRRPGQDTAALAAWVAAASGQDAAHPPFVIVSAEGGITRLRAVPLAGHVVRAPHGAPTSPMCALIIEYLPPRPVIDFLSVGAAYGLTAGERRYLEALTGARNATEAAETAGITRNTAKSHLSSIYAKTGAESQTQLMLLLGRFG